MARPLRPSVSWDVVERTFSEPVFSLSEVTAIVLSMGSPLPAELDRSELAVHLSNAVATYAFDYWRQEQPDSLQLEAAARTVAQASTVLLRSTGVSLDPFAAQHTVDPKSLYPFLGSGGLFGAAAADGEESGEAAVIEALQAVANLKRWAERLAVIAQRRLNMRPVKRSKGGRPNNAALDGLLERLTDIYEWAWRAPASLATSRDTGTADEGERAVLLGGLDARLYETGEALPVGFSRFLWEVMAAIDARGIPCCRLTPAAISLHWRRWRKAAETHCQIIKTQ